MKKRVFIIHGWDGFPEEGWFPWIKSELEKQNFEVTVPQMPKPENPRIYNWVPKLAEVVGTANHNTYFVGHSMGCQTILRYLETLPNDIQIGGAVFVAGFISKLINLEQEKEVHETAKHWLEAPLNLAKIKSHLPKSVLILSDDDLYVPIETQQDFKNAFDSKIIIEHNKGHFNDQLELPSALESILTLSS